jgi:transcriptional regulator with XRE-family HTH domain
LLEAWARNGLTDEQIAHNMGITAKTLYEWKNKYSEICESLKRGKEVVDILVENALLKRALGYKYKETKTIESKKDGMRTEVTIKEVAPDTTAQIFWLKNRNPEAWRDRREVESKVDFESDNFIEALKGQVKDTFADAGGIVEE